MADLALDFNLLVPQTREDGEKVTTQPFASNSGVLFKPMVGNSPMLTDEEAAAIKSRTEGIAQLSKDYNQSKGRDVNGYQEMVAKELKRLKEETRSFAYTNPYFAGPQVGVFISDKWMSNAASIEYSESSTDSPVYGYNSRHFDAVMEGNVIVQGTFTIQLTDGDYLGRLLRNYRETEGQGGGSDTVEGAQDAISAAKDYWWGTKEEAPSDVDIPMSFRHSYGLTGAVGRGFDIRIFYGAREFMETGTMPARFDGPIEVIKDVHITARNVMAGPSGEPVAEGWTFFARSVQTAQGDRTTRSLAVRPATPSKLWLPIRNLGQTIRPGSL